MHSKTGKQGELQHALHVPNFIDFFGDDWKEIKTQIEKSSIYICKIYICNIYIVPLVISENFLSTLRKNNVLTICISYKKAKINTFRTF